MSARRDFIKELGMSAFILSQAGFWSSCSAHGHKIIAPKGDTFFKRRGIIFEWDPQNMLDWPSIANKAGLNTLGVTISGTDNLSETWKNFSSECAKYDIQTENPQHAMSWLLPRNLFSKDPSMFRMNQAGERTPDYNCCTASEKGLEIIAENAVKNALAYPSTTGRYFFWQDDGGKKCHCPVDKNLSESDQALKIENAIIKRLRQENNAFTIAHLAYESTIPAPTQIKPEEGIFLQFAPYQRSYNFPISDSAAQKPGANITNGDYLNDLEQNLGVFPSQTAEILEYWLDDSLFSNYTKPEIKLPWNRDIFLNDINTYAGKGIRDIVSFAVYIDKDYVNRYKDISFINQFGTGLKDYRS